MRRRHRAPRLRGELAGRGADLSASCAASSTASTCGAADAKPAVALTAARVEAQSLDYVDLLVPGLLAMAIAQSAAFGVAFSLVAWRQKGMLPPAAR